MDQSFDMIASLYNLPQVKINEKIQIKRAYPSDKDIILDFIKKNFEKNWIYEAEYAIVSDISKCFVAVDNKKIIGFACFDSSAKGFFGPMGVLKKRRGEKIGATLLYKTLLAMKEYGYAYAIIGWVNDAKEFYEKTINAQVIQNSSPSNSVYSRLIEM